MNLVFFLKRSLFANHDKTPIRTGKIDGPVQNQLLAQFPGFQDQGLGYLVKRLVNAHENFGRGRGWDWFRINCLYSFYRVWQGSQRLPMPRCNFSECSHFPGYSPHNPTVIRV